jgi:small nuclear ribonucleoprotein (snRNP)-like protein
MTQMNLKLKNLSENRGTVKEMDLFTNLQDSEVQQQAIMSPLVQTPNEKLLQVNINTDPSNGVNKITLFKHRPRVFKY